MVYAFFKKKNVFKSQENHSYTRISYQGNTVRAKNGLTLPPSPPTPFSQILDSCWKVSVNRTITVFPGINTVSWTLKVSGTAFRTRRGESSQDQWNPSSCGRWTAFPAPPPSLKRKVGSKDRGCIDIFAHPKALTNSANPVSFLVAPYHASFHIEVRVKSND